MVDGDLNPPELSDQTPAPPTAEEVVRKLYGDGKPLIFVVFATQIAASADDLCELVQAFTSKKKLPEKVPPPPSVKRWIAMYRRHNRMWNALIPFDDVPGVGEATAQDASRGWRQLIAMPQDERKATLSEAASEDEIHEMLKLLLGVEFPPPQGVVTSLVRYFESEVKDGQDQIGEMIDSLEMQFFFRVWIPCWILYRAYPPSLMSKARSGDMDALDDLIRLDKSAVNDPRVAEHWHRIMLGGQTGAKTRLLRAMNGQPRGSVSPQKMRSFLSGMISQLAVSLMCPVTEPEIRELFNRIAFARGDKTDYQLTPSTQGLVKAIQRNRNWPSLPKPMPGQK